MARLKVQRQSGQLQAEITLADDIAWSYGVRLQASGYIPLRGEVELKPNEQVGLGAAESPAAFDAAFAKAVRLAEEDGAELAQSASHTASGLVIERQWPATGQQPRRANWRRVILVLGVLGFFVVLRAVACDNPGGEQGATDRALPAAPNPMTTGDHDR